MMLEIQNFVKPIKGLLASLVVGMINCWFGMGPGMNISNPAAAGISSITFRIGINGLSTSVGRRDPRTKTGWSRTERFGPGPKSRTSSDQHRKNLRYLGPDRIRTNKILKISDRFRLVGPRTRRSVDPWMRYLKKFL